MGMLQKLISYYRLFNILSIDVALGAICSAVFFKHSLHADITRYSLISLGLSVWIIYTVDHLLDAKKISTLATTNRHRFHQEHFRVLSAFVVLAASINAILLIFIRKPALITGVVLLALVMLYLLIQHSLKILKELFVAVVYTTGVMLPAMSNTQIVWSDWNWMMIADPIYDYDPITDSVQLALDNPKCVTVMAVDNLPCELPRSASEEFGRDLIDRILPCLFIDDPEKIVERGTIAANGKLTSNFEYLNDYIA